MIATINILATGVCFVAFAAGIQLVVLSFFLLRINSRRKGIGAMLVGFALLIAAAAAGIIIARGF